MEKLLAVFAHPDDETFICGGILAKAAKECGPVVLACATKGEMGRRMGVPPTETRETISSVREVELRAACKALGISYVHFLGLRDKTLEIQPIDLLKSAVLRLVSLEAPNTVVTFHPTWGGHPDHCAIGAAASAAFMDYSKRFSTTKLFYVCSGDMIRNPQRYGLESKDLIEYDVSPYLQQKLLAFRAHRTQSQMSEWLWGDDDKAAQKVWSLEYLLPYHRLHGRLPLKSDSMEASDHS